MTKSDLYSPMIFGAFFGGLGGGLIADLASDHRGVRIGGVIAGAVLGAAATYPSRNDIERYKIEKVFHKHVAGTGHRADDLAYASNPASTYF